jgi:hypothetical protein
MLEKNLFDVQLSELNKHINTLFFVFIDINSSMYLIKYILMLFHL